MGFRKIEITDIPGFKLGNAEDIQGGTGCTAVICEKGAVTGADVRGGGPATRETDLLRSENTVSGVHCVMLSGGSAFGLEAGSGAMNYLEKRNIGFKMGDICVPIVCQASLYDLEVASKDIRPDREMGEQACQNAYEGVFQHGNHGAGTGATVGKFCGMDRAMKSGLGTFACSDGNLYVGAVAAVNAIGDIYNGGGRLIAGVLSSDKKEIEGSINILKNMIVAKEEPIDKEEKEKKEEKEEDSINLTETPESENLADEDIPDEEVINEEEVPAVQSQSDQLQESTPSVEDAVLDYRDELPPEDLGEDVIFNTTITCLITNAKLTKSQANKLASVLHDGYARSIKPVHGTLDGDSIFVMSSGDVEVNFDAFAALATDTVQYSIIDAATSAEDAYGFPCAATMAGARH